VLTSYGQQIALPKNSESENDGHQDPSAFEAVLSGDTSVCAFKLSMSSSFYITGPVFHLLAIFLIDPASSN
jgi:hypothetical protein